VTEPAIAVHIDSISKRFGRVLALDDVSFDIRANEMFAILGPNGAGKSTLIMILCTLLRPDGGSATIMGKDVLRASRAVRRNLGVVFQEPSLDTRLTVEENLDFHGRVFEMSGKLRKQRMTELLELVELSDVRGRLVRTLSAGMKRRVEIARALMHDSKVVILDEPTVGLDAQSRARLWEYLERIRREREVTLIVTTHYIEEVEPCDRVCIIDHGKVLALDTPDALKASYGEQAIRLTPRDSAAEAAILERFPEAVRSPDGELVLASGDPAVTETLLGEFGSQLHSFSVDRSSLESVFLRLTGRDIRDKPDASARTHEGVPPGQEPRM